MNAIPIWKGCLSAIKARKPMENFDGESFHAFFKLNQSICEVIYKTGNPKFDTASNQSDLQEELVKLREICEVASARNLSQGQFDQEGINAQIGRIRNLAKLLTRDDEVVVNMTSSSFTDKTYGR